MNHSIFLDTDIFFECFECPKFETIIEQAVTTPSAKAKGVVTFDIEMLLM